MIVETPVTRFVAGVCLIQSAMILVGCGAVVGTYEILQGAGLPWQAPLHWIIPCLVFSQAIAAAVAGLWVLVVGRGLPVWLGGAMCMLPLTLPSLFGTVLPGAVILGALMIETALEWDEEAEAEAFRRARSPPVRPARVLRLARST